MAQEKEIKIQLKEISKESFISRICNKGFILKKIIPQEDIYFDTVNWYLYESLAALRIRKIKDTFDSFSFKKVFYLPERSDPFYIEELEVEFPLDKKICNQILKKVEIPLSKKYLESGDSLLHYLRMHGYHDEQHLRKIRYLYIQDDNEIIIDDVDGIGIIIELECHVEEPMEIIQTLLDPHEWVRSTEGTGYLWLSKHKGLISHKSNIQKFAKNPTWNVWKHEELFYQKLI